MSKTVMHQLLACESDVKTRANNAKKELRQAFYNPAQFDGYERTFEALNEEEYGYMNGTETKSSTMTVAEMLEFSREAIAKGIDVQVSKEQTNASGNASAELKVGSVSFGELSATALLSLEKELADMHKLFSDILTLEPGKDWKRDDFTEGVCFKTEPSKNYKTQKDKDFKVVVQATKEFPADVREIVKDVVIGTYKTTYKSGKITPLMKSQIVNKVAELLSEVKKARAKANEVEIVPSSVGFDIMDFIFDDVK